MQISRAAEEEAEIVTVRLPVPSAGIEVLAAFVAVRPVHVLGIVVVVDADWLIELGFASETTRLADPPCWTLPLHVQLEPEPVQAWDSKVTPETCRPGAVTVTFVFAPPS